MADSLAAFPDDQIQILVLRIFGLRHTRITALVFTGIWLLIQLVNEAGSIASVVEGGVAYFVLIGSFDGGLLLIKPFSLRRRTPDA